MNSFATWLHTDASATVRAMMGADCTCASFSWEVGRTSGLLEATEMSLGTTDEVLDNSIEEDVGRTADQEAHLANTIDGFIDTFGDHVEALHARVMPCERYDLTVSFMSTPTGMDIGITAIDQATGAITSAPVVVNDGDIDAFVAFLRASQP